MYYLVYNKEYNQYTVLKPDTYNSIWYGQWVASPTSLTHDVKYYDSDTLDMDEEEDSMEGFSMADWYANARIGKSTTTIAKSHNLDNLLPRAKALHPEIFI